MPIKALIVDHGGVMTPGGEKGTNERTATEHLGLEEVIQVTDLNDLLKCGKITNDFYVAEINRRNPQAPHHLTSAMWTDIYRSMTREPLIFELLAQCREMGLRTGLLSNNNAAVVGLLRKNRWFDNLNPCVISCEEGVAKPNPLIYERVEVLLPGIRPEEILFLDDQQKCVDGAIARGWRAVLVKNPQQAVRDTRRLLGWS